jgi:MFS family permease
VGMFAGAVVALAVFVVVESRAVDPILPLRLFRQQVFSVSVILAFIVGFAMLGAITFLPTYLQYVKGISATGSGVRTLPLVVGLLVTSLLSGTVVGRTGRYKVFPVAGTFVMAVGLYLLSRMDAHTGFLTMAAYMLVLGAGIGLCMQVLTIIVQNTADYRDLGVATSGVTFFRTLGSSFGAAIFGTVYANVLQTRLVQAIASTRGVDPAAINTPKQLHAYPATQIAPIVDAYAHAMHIVFLAAVPVAGAAFVLALFLKEVPLRESSRAGAADVGGGFGMPESGDSNQQLQVAIARLIRTRGGAALDRLRRSSGTDLDVANAWCLGEVHLRDRLGSDTALSAIAGRRRIPAEVLAPAFDNARSAGYLTGSNDQLQLTDLGHVEMDKLIASLRRWLATELADWGADDDEQLSAALAELAKGMLTEDAPMPGELQAAAR